MFSNYLKAKIHRATVTDADLHYEGSISIDPDILGASHIEPYERVDIYNVTNGERFSTYAIPGKAGEFCLNGAAAWKARVGDRIIIATYCWMEPEEARQYKPTVVLMGEGNVVKSVTQGTLGSH